MKTVACAHGLITFKQHAGECWSDSITVLLLFSGGVGQTIQRKLLEKGIVEQFTSRLNSYEIKGLIQTLHKTTDESYPVFCKYAILYMVCLRDRFANRFVNAGGSDGIRRSKSCVFSRCQASSGLIANEILNPLHFTPEQLNLKKAVNFTKFFNNLNSVNTTLNLAYSPGIMTPLLAIYMYFFFGRNLFMQHSKFISPSVEFNNRSYLLGFNAQREKSLMIYDDIKWKYNMNFVMSLRTSKCHEAASNGGHGLCLVTCESGESFLYDDNNAYLQIFPLEKYIVLLRNVADFTNSGLYYLQVNNGVFIKPGLEAIMRIITNFVSEQPITYADCRLRILLYICYQIDLYELNDLDTYSLFIDSLETWSGPVAEFFMNYDEISNVIVVTNSTLKFNVFLKDSVIELDLSKDKLLNLLFTKLFKHDYKKFFGFLTWRNWVEPLEENLFPGLPSVFFAHETRLMKPKEEQALMDNLVIFGEHTTLTWWSQLDDQKRDSSLYKRVSEECFINIYYQSADYVGFFNLTILDPKNPNLTPNTDLGVFPMKGRVTGGTRRKKRISKT